MGTRRVLVDESSNRSLRARPAHALIEAGRAEVLRDAFRKTRRYLMQAHGLDEDEALSLMSVAVDFGVTQVVDGNWGVHAVIRKAVLPAGPRAGDG